MYMSQAPRPYNLFHVHRSHMAHSVYLQLLLAARGPGVGIDGTTTTCCFSNPEFKPFRKKTMHENHQNKPISTQNHRY